MNKQPFSSSKKQIPFHDSSTINFHTEVNDCPPVVPGSAGTTGVPSEQLTSPAPPNKQGGANYNTFR